MSARHAQQTAIRRRSRARRLAMQALYQWHINPSSVTDLKRQYTEKKEYADADADYFDELLRQALHDVETNSDAIASHADRELSALDPLEMAIMMVALTELRHHIDVPYKVVINEAIELSRRFGATDGHKYVNAILDRAAAQLRAVEKR
ncbi:MAG: transcription antitermination factor NusB [Pseudomonadota bacterium]